MLKISYLIPLVSLFLSACATIMPISPTRTPEPSSTPSPSPTPEGQRAGWNLIWHDEFNDEALDLQNWTFDLGASGWGNGEMEEYTNRTDNVRVENGNLIIEARADPSSPYGYTSARIKTQDLHDWQYGRVEGRLKLPQGQGIWPAFWMLGNDIGKMASWPKCGEIDILEMIGRQPDTIYNAVHGQGYSGAQNIGTHTDFPQGSLQNAFHVYAIEWEADEIRWYVDEVEVFKVTAEAVPNKWAFDHPFFIILNVAVGGGWPGFPDASTTFPQQMLVDYVRVYQRP